MTIEENLYCIAYAIIKVFNEVIKKSHPFSVTYKEDYKSIINEIIKKAEEKFDVVESKHKDKPKRTLLHYPWKGDNKDIKAKIVLEVAIDSMIYSFEMKKGKNLSGVECNKLMGDILECLWSAFILNIDANDKDKSRINVLLWEFIKKGKTIDKVDMVFLDPL